MPNSTLPIDERQMERLESSFPAASGVAFANAYQQAVQAGLTVLVSEDGVLFDVFPDGQRKAIKNIAPPSITRPGQKLKLQ